MLSINQFHDLVKRTHYKQCLMESVKKRAFKLNDMKKLEKKNYPFEDCFHALRRAKSMDIFFNMLLHNKQYLQNEQQEQMYRSTFLQQLRFCMDKLSDAELKSIGLGVLEKNIYYNFYVGYNNLNNKEMLETLVSFYKKLCGCKQCARIGNDRVLCKQHPRRKKDGRFVLDGLGSTGGAGRKVKIGIVCNQLFNTRKPVFRDRNEVVKHLDNTCFDVSIVSSETVNTIYPNATLITCTKENVVDVVNAQKYDIIFYPEVGMDFFTLKCAMHRCAPVQVVTWGHSETTGMHTIDYYISSKYFNKESDFVYFTEKLVRMKSLGTYYNPMESLIEDESVESICAKYKIDRSMHIYNCTQVPAKTVRYEYISMAKQLLDRDPKAVILMIYMTQPQQVFFKNVFKQYGDRVRVYHYLKRPEYQKLVSISHILIDPYPFGSLNTTLDAFRFGKVILAIPSLKINGNFCSGFYKRMGVTELICSSVDEYITKAIRLASDDSYRMNLEKEVQEKMNALFHEKESLHEYNAFFRGLCATQEWAGAHVSSDVEVANDVTGVVSCDGASYYPDATDGAGVMEDVLHSTMKYAVYQVISSGGLEERYGVSTNTIYVDRYNMAWVMIHERFYAHGLVFGKFIFGLSDKDNLVISRMLHNGVVLHNERIMPMMEHRQVLDDYSARMKKHGSGKLVGDGDVTPSGKEVITWMIAVYNRADIVGETLNSLLGQTNQEFKCIICDDGSSDNSVEVVRSLVGDDSRFTIYEKENGGYVHTCNFMSSKVTTEVMAIVDSDDVLDPRANEMFLNVYRKQTCSAVYSGYYLCDANLNVRKTVIPDYDPHAVVGPNIDHVTGRGARELLISNPFEHLRSWRVGCLPSGAFPRYLISAEDQDLAYRFEEMGRETIHRIPQALVKFRRGYKNSLMHNKKTYVQARQHHYRGKLAALQRRNVMIQKE